LGGPFPLKFGGLKTSKFRRSFGQLCNLIANMSGMQQDIVSQKTALNYGHYRTGKLNLVYFGPQMAKIGPEFWQYMKIQPRQFPNVLLVWSDMD